MIVIPQLTVVAPATEALLEPRRMIVANILPRLTSKRENDKNVLHYIISYTLVRNFCAKHRTTSIKTIHLREMSIPLSLYVLP